MAYANLTGADHLLVGSAYRAAANPENRRGVVITPHRYFPVGTLAAALSEGIIKDATGTQIPDAAETVTYTATTDGTDPQDGTTRPTKTSISVGGVTYDVLDLTGDATLGRNISIAVTHGSSIVAMTALVYGFDIYKKPVTELLTITATGTSKTAAGKKAMRYFWKVDLTAAADASANTVDLGTGNVFGFAYRVDSKNAVTVRKDGVTDASATIVVADTNTATTTTGDVRGTVDFNTDPNGAADYSIAIDIVDTSSEAAVYGVAQA